MLARSGASPFQFAFALQKMRARIKDANRFDPTEKRRKLKPESVLYVVLAPTTREERINIEMKSFACQQVMRRRCTSCC